MDVLVDYDNIPLSEQRKGIEYIADRIVRLVWDFLTEGDRHVRLRLYGGWYEDRRYTRKAQDLSQAVDESFPTVIRVAIDDGKTRPFHVSVELAVSITPLPAKHLLATYRPRSAPTSIRCRHPSELGCTDPDCPMLIVHDFFEHGTCPGEGCSHTYEEFMEKAEQKLVDTMMVVDMLHMTREGEDAIVVVSSDDDLWPGIIGAVSCGARVLHIQTRNRKFERPYYRANLPCEYSVRHLTGGRSNAQR